MASKSLGVCIARNSSMQTQGMSSFGTVGFSVIKTGCAFKTWHMLRVSSILLFSPCSLFAAMLPTITRFSSEMFIMKSKGAFFTGEMLQKANFLKTLKRSACLAIARVAFVSMQYWRLLVFSKMSMGFATGRPNVLAKLYAEVTEAFAMPLS